MKGQIINTLGSAGKIISVVNNQFCNYSRIVTDIKKTNGSGCVPIQLHLQKQAIGSSWPMDYSLLIPDMDNDSFIPVL